jgi:uncharacterized protein (DUF488 family)
MTRHEPVAPPLVLTIGHSTQPLPAFLEMLQGHAVRRLVDVRTVPRSRHNPQFNRDSLPEALGAVGIRYTHMPGLGGLRHPRAGSVNAAWRNDSFRGFADYMQTPEFAANLQALIERARKERVALMCAEAVPWRCHRSLIADALVVRSVSVQHIMSSTRAEPHTLTPWARVEGECVTYPPGVESGERGSGIRRSRGKGRAGIR